MSTENQDCYSDFIGFLPIKEEYMFDEGKLELIDDFEKALELIKSKVNKYDGCYYPDYESQRPVPPISVLPSHRLVIKSISNDKIYRYKLSGFIMRLIGYLLGFRLEFCDWVIDCKFSLLKDQSYKYFLTNKGVVINDFLNQSIATFKSWSDQNQMRITNILFLHNRATVYMFEWEWFSTEYMIFDGLYKLLSSLNNDKTKVKHEERINQVINDLNLMNNNEEVKKIVYLRNNLIHECLWGITTDKPNDIMRKFPGISQGYDVISTCHNIRKLNQRIICAILGYHNEYSKSSWTLIDNLQFDLLNKS